MKEGKGLAITQVQAKDQTQPSPALTLVVCLCLGTFASLPAGYMLSGGYSWRLFFYVEFAFAMALLVLAFFFVEETSYVRIVSVTPSTPPSELEKNGVPHELERAVQTTSSVTPARKTFVQTLSLRGRVDHDVPFFTMMARSFTYFLVPQSLWVITTFGINGKYSSTIGKDSPFVFKAARDFLPSCIEANILVVCHAP